MIPKEKYKDFINDVSYAHSVVEGAFSENPELFPPSMHGHFKFNGLTPPSKKMGVQLRFLQTGCVTYRIYPHFVLPYMRGEVTDVSDALSLARWVPYWAISEAFGCNPMYWYRAHNSIGAKSIAGTTIQKGTSIPVDLVADEHHSKLSGVKVYVATVVANGCFLGAEVSRTANEGGLAGAYGVFKEEARALSPSYAPKIVNLDGWKAGQRAWLSLFPKVVVINCFLHAFIKVRDRATKKLKGVFRIASEKVWGCYNAAGKRGFSQRVRRFAEWAKEAVPNSPMKDNLFVLCGKSRQWQVFYSHPNAYRTSNMLDKLMRFMDRYLNKNQTFHGGRFSSNKTIRAFALSMSFTYGWRFIKFLLIVFFLHTFQISGAIGAIPHGNDRWLEIDLYWFDHKDMEKSAKQFWDRFHPLMENVDGWKGVILNVGWLSQYILGWEGNPNAMLALPKNMKMWSMFKDTGQLSGDTNERIQLWKNRFDQADTAKIIDYDEWTYADLKRLASLIRETALKKYKLKDIKVGTLVFGGESIYKGDKMMFALIHPEVFWNRHPNLIARLSTDNRKYGAFPEGIPEGIPLTEFFGKQWGNLSKVVGLDAIVLRDGYLGVKLYSRNGPYGKKAPSDPELVRSWSNATADLVSQVKQSNPKALVIGYSNGASAVADWRVNCFDLETIAKEGFLDAWIDQTWAGAWNEVGQRPGLFWNLQTLGWTYQLSYMLEHAALLADTKVHHYFLTETFDAWESWDVIHNAKERLRWGIWAYSHAAVKKPDGLKMPVGNYISWCNQGKRLLSEEDILFLTETSNAAFRDAKETEEIFGPTLVYCRSAMEWQTRNKPDVFIKEWIDEQAGSLMKWSVPILSITRSEYIPKVESDLFIFQTPVNLTQQEKEDVIGILRSEKPTAVFGSPVNGIDPDILNLFGISSIQENRDAIKYIGITSGQTDGIFNKIPNTFPIYQPYSSNKSLTDVEVVYSVDGSPCLTVNHEAGKQLIFWDPPELLVNLPDMKNTGFPLDEILGSPIPFVLTARLFNKVMKENGTINADEIRQYYPVNYTCWKLKDGTYKVLAGNLEEGINHTADHSVKIVLDIKGFNDLPDLIEINELWNGTKTITGNKKLIINLNQAETKLLKF